MTLAQIRGWTPPKPRLDRGYWKLYIDHVLGGGYGGGFRLFGGQIGDLGFAGESLVQILKIANKGTTTMKRDDFSLAVFNEKLQKIDFSLVRMKLCHQLHGNGWSCEKASAAELQYRQYLSLHYLFGGTTPLVPTALADQFWHQHILDTRQYEKDCDFLFGCFLHHFPYFGLRDKADEAALYEASKTTRALTLQFFPSAHETIADSSDGGSSCDSSSCSSCKSCSSGPN